MSALKIGSLFSGYSGLDMAVGAAMNAETAWFSEYAKAPSRILAHHYPHIPNHGDITTIDWASVEPVDIITGGSPCQDLSAAGRRRGMTEGTRSNLWVQMRECIAQLQPQTVVWENVRGAFSARAVSEVESEPGLLGIGPDRPALRAFGRVLGDLSDLGFDASWVGLRASSIGAAHPRFRLFVVAHANGSRGTKGNPAPGRGNQSLDGAGVADERAAHHPVDAAQASPTHAGGKRFGEHPRATLAEEAGAYAGDLAANRFGLRPNQEWGPYSEAVEQWERVVGRRAPVGTRPDGKDGRDRANPELGEWLMGLPAGWVTSPDIGLSWADQWEAIGNGVVPQQAEFAIRYLLEHNALELA